ncbi:protein ERGIC-53-like [Ochotona princeps]|uniref:protein ERGIC-53-like n=1 Tax=Ochotona princeps TaxID=9978 RepID=UPI002714ABBD|nr:protein ERGIC-53-like [Ochotona princeps]
MLGTRGPVPLLVGLLLLLPGLCGPGGRRAPRRRFEYKFSFKGPRWSPPGAGIPFWSHHGDAILGLEEVRLVPSLRDRRGAVWTRAPVLFPSWEVEVQLRVTGPGRRGTQGMAVWYTRERSKEGPILGGPAEWDGVGILFESSAGDAQDSPVIRVLVADGRSPSAQSRDGASRVLGLCHRNFRNWPFPFRVRITYWEQRLRVSSNSGLTPYDPEEFCVDVGPLLLPSGGFFGVSAATGTLADDHDVLTFLTFSLQEPSPEDPPQPISESEQLRLAEQLQGLRARLALGTREDIVVPKLDFKAQDMGERLPELEETLSRNSQALQALRALSEQLVQAERQWKQQLGLPGQVKPEGGWARAMAVALGNRLVLLLDPQDSAKLSTLFSAQQTLLQALQEMRNRAVLMASSARGSFLPLGTAHHFSELEQTLSLLHKDLRGVVKTASQTPRFPGGRPRASSCLRPGVFLLFLVTQTVGFFCYLHFRQELDKRFRECLSRGALPLGPALHPAGALGALRRQPFNPSSQA